MKSVRQIENVSAGDVILSNNLTEFHASRLLLLIYFCGTRDRKLKLEKIDGLTKLAKLDFFVRYPAFFERVTKLLEIDLVLVKKDLESKMVRYHYGPWDSRYYQILPYLEARDLIRITKNTSNNGYVFLLTEEGQKVALQFSEAEVFSGLASNMKEVAQILSRLSGNRLKNLVYEVFDKEVGTKRLGEIIE